MSSIQPPITTRLLRTDPEALRQQLTTTTLDARTATDLVKQAGYLGTLTPAQLDVFTAAAASPGASAVARDVVQTFLSGLQQKPASASLFSFLHWKPAPSPSVAVAADRAVTDATRKATGAVRAFLATVDPLLARTSLSQLLGRKDIAAAILHLDNAPAHNVATSELLKSLLKEIKAPPPFADVYAQVGKRSVDTSFATELLRSAALSSSPAAAYEKIADLEHSRVPMSECGRAFCAGINQALTNGATDVGDLYQGAMHGQFGGRGVRGARDAMASFDQALADFDPVLAEKGRSLLLLDPGRDPKLQQAWSSICQASGGDEGENLRAFAKQAIKAAFA